MGDHRTAFMLKGALLWAKRRQPCVLEGSLQRAVEMNERSAYEHSIDQRRSASLDVVVDARRYDPGRYVRNEEEGGLEAGRRSRRRSRCVALQRGAPASKDAVRCRAPIYSSW